MNIGIREHKNSHSQSERENMVSSSPRILQGTWSTLTTTGRQRQPLAPRSRWTNDPRHGIESQLNHWWEQSPVLPGSISGSRQSICFLSLMELVTGLTLRPSSYSFKYNLKIIFKPENYYLKECCILPSCNPVYPLLYAYSLKRE